MQDGRYGNAVDPRNKLALACWKYNGRIHKSWGSEYEQRNLLRDIENSDFIVCHNGKYELGWLVRCGIVLETVVLFDTQLAEYVLLGNLAAIDDRTGLAPVRVSLDACCRRRGIPGKDPIVNTWMKNGIDVFSMPRAWVEQRCIRDVRSTEDLFGQQLKSLQRTGRLPVLMTRTLLTPVLTDIERQGVCLDEKRVQSTYTTYTSKLQELESQIDSLTGGINWRSQKQVGDFLYDTLGFQELTNRDGTPKRTGTGRRLTSSKILPVLKCTSPQQAAFLKIKSELSKTGHALAKNLTYFKDAVDNHDGIFYATFNQTRTATHRLSSSGIPTSAGTVQFQNLPRGFKSLFRAREAGHQIMEIDGRQLEFRVAAFLGNDRQARADILDKEWDAHIITAAAMAQKDPRDLYLAYKAGDKRAIELRQNAKPETFKPLYGGSKGTPAQERWYRAFRERYPDLANVQKDWVAEVLNTKKLVTPWGLRYYWPRATVNKFGYCNIQASVYNYPVQALATAEIIPIALAYFWHATANLRDSGAIRIVNTVHDSVVVELSPDVVDEVKEIAITSFTTNVYSYLKSVYGMDFTIPLGVGIKCGEFLGEGNEELWNVFNDGRRERC